METKISMKTIYLILVITIGLVGLGIGSTLAVFTASAEISNPISFSSNLSYNGDVFDTVEVTIGPNATRTTNVSIFNDEQINGVKYAVWYIYKGNSNDISFVRNQESDIDPSGTDIGQGGTLGMDIKNNTSNTITITIGLTTSKDDIVLPSYMKVITLTTVAKYNLTLTKGTGISIMYYKINGSNTYASTTNSSITVSVNEGSTYYYYGIASTGYAMNSCSSSSSPCSGTMGASAVTKSLTATANSYNLTLIKGTGVSNIFYKVNGASSYTAMSKNRFEVSLDVIYGTTYYYYGSVSSRGYTLDSCTSSNPCSGTMGAGDVTKTLSATPNKYSITLEKETGVDKIYYKIGSAGSYTNTTNSSVTFSADFNETIYYYGTPLTGYTMGDGRGACTASSPCSHKVAIINSAKTISATANNYNLTLNKGTGVSTIYYKINGASSYSSSTTSKTVAVKYGTTYYYYGTASTGYSMSSCTASSPCSGTMGASAVTKSLTATYNGSSGTFVVSLYVDGDSKGSTTVSAGSKYEKTFMSPTSSMTCSCTNGQTCSISSGSGNNYTITINAVSANTTCNVEY